MTSNPNELLKKVNDSGFDGAIALATEAEVAEGAACGQLCLVHEAMKKE